MPFNKLDLAGPEVPQNLDSINISELGINLIKNDGRDIMPFCTSHFSSSPIIGQFLGENRWIKTVLEAFLKHFIRNVNHLAWPDPRAINGDFDQTKHFMDRLELIKLATSLGGVSSLANQPITNTHAALSPENRAKAGISESLVRLSVGIENVDMLIHDLGQALEKV